MKILWLGNVILPEASEYLKIKNKYLSYNDPKHKKSFICYIEAVNNVYNARMSWK